MKLRLILGLAIGLALIAALFAAFSTAAIGHALATLGWSGFAAIVAFQLGLTVIMGIAWWLLGRDRLDAHPWRFVWGRLVRDAASQALPLSQLGGMVLGARALAVSGVEGAFATASLVADVGVELTALIFYALLGLALLWWLRPASGLIAPIALGVVAMAALAAAFVAAQVRAGGLIGGWLARRAQRWSEASRQYAFSLPWAMRRIHRRYATLALALLLHVVCWMLTGVQAWLTFRLMHVRVGFGAALVIDSLAFGARGILFMVPSGIGVQEGAYVLLGAQFGVGPEVALAVSLARRGRDLVIAVPVLVALQYCEGRRLWRRPARGSIVTPAETGLPPGPPAAPARRPAALPPPPA